jgi:hypothetical protein
MKLIKLEKMAQPRKTVVANRFVRGRSKKNDRSALPVSVK